VKGLRCLVTLNLLFATASCISHLSCVSKNLAKKKIKCLKVNCTNCDRLCLKYSMVQVILSVTVIVYSLLQSDAMLLLKNVCIV
jgi:hypothetical protein